MTIIMTATGFKVGSKGKVANTVEKAAEAFAMLPKGLARKARKELHAAGKKNLAAVSRKAA